MVLYLSVCFCVVLIMALFVVFFNFCVCDSFFINNQIFHSSFLKAVELVFSSSELLQKRQNFICRFILIHRFHPQFFVTLVPNYGSTASSLKKRKEFELVLTFWHRSFTFNSNKSQTWCNSFSVYYPDVCLQLNMFRAFSRPSSGAQWLQWQPLVLPSYRGDSRAVFVVGPAGRPNHEHSMTVTTIWR